MYSNAARQLVEILGRLKSFLVVFPRWEIYYYIIACDYVRFFSPGTRGIFFSLIVKLSICHKLCSYLHSFISLELDFYIFFTLRKMDWVFFPNSKFYFRDHL